MISLMAASRGVIFLTVGSLVLVCASTGLASFGFDVADFLVFVDDDDLLLRLLSLVGAAESVDLDDFFDDFFVIAFDGSVSPTTRLDELFFDVLETATVCSVLLGMFVYDERDKLLV